MTRPALASLLGLALAFQPAIAGADGQDGADTSRWDCTLCPYRYGWYGEFDWGGGWVSDGSNKFGDYRGLDDEGGFLALDGEAHYRAQGGRFFDGTATDLGTDARRLAVRGGTRGRYAVKLEYREIPKYRGFGSGTPYRGVGGDSLPLPAGWERAPLTSGMTGLAAALNPVDLETTRRIVDAALTWRLARRWSLDVGYQHQSKEGTRPFGAGVFTINSTLFPAPVDFSTDRVDSSLNFNGERSHWRVGLTGSSFDNAFESITRQNPFSGAPGTEMLRSGLEPDNSAWRFDLAGAWAPRPNIRLSASAAVGRLEQDERLLPYSINPQFSDIPLPRMTADTRVDVGTIDVAGKLSARLSRRLDLTARWQRDERDNETPVATWTPVIGDLIEREARPNRPYSFERDRAGLSLRYRATSSLRLQAGVDREDFERTLQAVAETGESGWFAEAAWNASAMVELRARLEHSDRDGEPYIPVEDFALPEHPLMRKFNLADRDRSRLRLDLDYFPHPRFAVNLAYRGGEDDYRRSMSGLLESEEQSVSLDLSWNPSDTVTAFAFVSRDEFDSSQAGAEGEAAAPWLATTDDTFATTGLGVTASIGPRLDLGLDLVYSDADGDIDTDSGAGESPFPTLTTELRNARLRIEYRATDSWGLKLYLEHEKYDSADWALDGIAADSIPGVLSLGTESPDYSVTVVRAQASFSF